MRVPVRPLVRRTVVSAASTEPTVTIVSPRSHNLGLDLRGEHDAGRAPMTSTASARLGASRVVQEWSLRRSARKYQHRSSDAEEDDQQQQNQSDGRQGVTTLPR
ncbi:hypothetical protein GCM10023238_30480 [Streptomyces heliomycini]